MSVFFWLTSWLSGKQAVDKLSVGILVVDLLTSRIVSKIYILHAKKNICVRIFPVDWLTLWKVGFRKIRCWHFGGWLVDFMDSEQILHSTLYMLKNGCWRFAGWLVDFPKLYILHGKKKLYGCVFWQLTGWLYGEQALDKLGVGILLVD